MADAYLNLAEDVLAASGTPMRPRDILRVAYLNRLVPSHLHGATQHKTLHARLSEDVSTYREASRFYRTGPGVFFLRRLRNDAMPVVGSEEFFAPPRKKELRRDWVMALRMSFGHSNVAKQISLQTIKGELDDGKFGYFPYSVVRREGNLAVVHSFVVVFNGDDVLSYRTGRFYPSTDPLRGRRSVGVGGAVLIGEADLLYESMHGIVANGIAELGYAIGLPRRLAEVARYENQVRPVLAVAVPGSDSHPNVLHVVMAYRCPPDFFPSKAAMSINDLRWLNAFNPTNNAEDFDATSRLLIEQKMLVGLSSMAGSA